MGVVAGSAGLPTTTTGAAAAFPAAAITGELIEIRAGAAASTGRSTGLAAVPSIVMKVVVVAETGLCTASKLSTVFVAVASNGGTMGGPAT